MRNLFHSQSISTHRPYRGIATIQPILLIAVAAFMLTAIKAYFASESGIMGLTGNVVAQLLAGEGKDVDSGGEGGDDPIEIEPIPDPTEPDDSSTARRLDPTSILGDGQITKSHKDHQNRKRPSAGVDIDADGLPEGSRAPVHSPVSGRVTISGGQYGTVEIVDADGNRHRLLHFSGTSVSVGDYVNAGDQIGQLGNTTPLGVEPVRDHVHYQIKDDDGNFLDPEEFEYDDAR